MTCVLVTYATAHGSTREIAERAAARLTEHGLCVECVPATRVEDPRGYDAFVIGSAIHHQAWLPEAIRFVDGHATLLGQRPAWLFSVGRPAALAPALRGWAAQEGSKVLEPMRTRVHPKGEQLFAGVMRRDQLSATGRLAFWLMGGTYGDFRDNQEIDGWAEQIARELLAGATPAGSTTPPGAAAGAHRAMVPVSPRLRAVVRIALLVLYLVVVVLLLREFFLNM